MTFDAKVPLNLKNTQQWFASIISRPIDQSSHMNPISPSGNLMEEEAAFYIAPSPTMRSAQRIQIYNQQYWWRLLNTLHEIYPLVTRLFGYEDFNQTIAIPYLVKYPPYHWSLTTLGNRLPDWIEDNYHAQDKKLVYDAAKIDHSFNSCFLAPERAGIGNSGETSSLLNQKLYLQSFVKPFEMNYHLFQFRTEFLKQEPEYWVDHDFPELLHEKHYFFVLYRNRKNDLSSNEISEGEYHLLRQFQVGTSIDDACQWLEGQPESIYEAATKHLHLWFQEWTARGWLTQESLSHNQ